MEIWKDIKGYPNYQISNYGRIWSKYTQRYLKPYLKKSGYYSVGLTAINGKLKTERLHRLVALNFVENPNGYSVVNHKDGDKTNNRASNLEWCTVAQNTKHAYDNNLSGFQETALKNLDKLNNIYNPHNVAVEAYFNEKYVGTYKSKETASKATGVSVKTIYNRLHGRFSNRNGWDFKEVVI